MQDYEVIILAAGESSRLFPITKHFPKCLLPIGKKTLLEHQIGFLKNHGFQSFSLVSGHKHNTILPIAAREKIKVIHNKDYKNTNSLYSLWLTSGKYNRDIIILNSDLYFDQKLVSLILKNEDKNFAIIDASAKWDEESTKVKVRNNAIVKWSRSFTKKEFSGENVGLVKILKKNVPLFYKTVDALIRNNNHKKWWPEALNQFARKDIL